ncbi:unnamed protein product [Scytosiphon promiscuus]
MADVVVLIIQVVDEINDIAKGIKESDRQANRLSERVAAVEPAVFAIKHGRRARSSSESLRQLSAALEDIRDFLSAYAGTSKVNRAMNRKSNSTTFARLGALLTEGMQALQLNVSVEEWAKEDTSDRLEDLENFIDMLESMERQRNRNHAEVVGNQAEQMGVLKDVLKTLRRDERSELTESFEINIDKDLDFENSIRLGQGGFGEVRTAKWNGVDVAVKQLLPGRLDRDDIRAFRKEVRIHSDLRFAHVVQLYAACTIAPNLCLVIELASGGSLRQYLHSSSEPLAHALQAAFLYDIARGMSFLHSRGILHRDLKSANVLMFDNGRLKLCDFGLSKVKTESSKTGGGAAGTVPWMAPEVLGESSANERTDVYSFGVVSFEVAARAEPFKGMNAPQVIMAVAVSKKRPQVPEGASASPDVVSLMEKCWKHNPADRPEGFGSVIRALGSVVSRVGDPRMLSAAAVYFTPSSDAKRGGVPSNDVPTAPLTVSGGLGASPLDGMPLKEPLATAAGPGVSPTESVEKLEIEGWSKERGVHGTAAVDSSPSSDAQRGGVSSADVPTAPLIVSGGLGASHLDGMPLKEPLATAARPGVSPTESVEKREIEGWSKERRVHGAAAVDSSPSSDAQRGGVPSAHSPTAPLTVGGGLGASLLDGMPLTEPLATAARPGVSPTESVEKREKEERPQEGGVEKSLEIMPETRPSKSMPAQEQMSIATRLARRKVGTSGRMEKRDTLERIRGRVYVRALHDFDGTQDGDLSLKAGDIVTADAGEYSAGGWVSGVCHGKKGIFPANYTEEFDAIEAAKAVEIGITPPTVRGDVQTSLESIPPTEPLAPGAAAVDFTPSLGAMRDGAASVDARTAPPSYDSHFDDLTTKELLATAARLGVSTSGMVEKKEIVERIIARGNDGAAAVSVAPSSGAMPDSTASADVRAAPPRHSGGVETSPLYNMSSKELLATAARLGVSTSGMVEKKEIVELIIARGNDGAAAVNVAPSSGAMPDGAASADVRAAPPRHSGGVETSPLYNMSPKELRAIAASLGIVVIGSVEKRCIVERIRGRFFVRALYDYNGMGNEELSFKAGDVITTDGGECSGHEWMTGFCHGKRGTFPAKYAQRFEAIEPLTDHAADAKVATDIRKEADRLRKQGKYAEAGPLYLVATNVQEKILGPDHLDLATTLNNRGKLLHKQLEYDDAKMPLERSLGIREEALGRDHPDVAETLVNLARVLFDQAEFSYFQTNHEEALMRCERSNKEALLLTGRSLDIRMKALGLNHPDVAESLIQEGYLLTKQGELHEAFPRYKRSLDIRENALGPEHPDVAESLVVGAELFERMGKKEEVERQYQRSVAIQEKALGPHHPDFAVTLFDWGYYYKEQGKLEEAKPLLVRATDIFAKTLGGDHWIVAYSLGLQAQMSHAQENHVESERLFRRAIDIGEARLADGPLFADWHENLASSLKKQGKLAEADRLFLHLASMLNNRASVLFGQGKYSEALPLFEKALSINKETLGEKDPNTVNAKAWVKSVRKKFGKKKSWF